MDAMKKMKRESIVRLLLPIALLVLFGIVFISTSNIFAEEPTPQNIYDVPRNSLEGSYVTVDVDWIYACYAYTEEYENNVATGRITEREYVIDANLDDYCALIVDGSLMKQAEALLAECDAYYYGETDEITKSFTVTGWVRSLPNDSRNLYYDIFDYDNLSAEEQEYILPLYLDPADYSVQAVPLVFGLVLIGIAAALLVMALTGRFQKQIREKMQKSAWSEEKLNELLGHMYRDVPAVAGLRIDSGYVFLRNGSSHFLFDCSDLVWAYQQVVRHKIYGIIPAGKSYSLILKLADGKQKMVSMNEAKIQAQLQKISAQFPTCVIGYNDQFASLYRTDRNALRQIASAQRESL